MLKLTNGLNRFLTEGIKLSKHGEIKRLNVALQPREAKEVAMAPASGAAAVRLVEKLERSPSGKPDYRWARAIAEAESVAPAES